MIVSDGNCVGEKQVLFSMVNNVAVTWRERWLLLAIWWTTTVVDLQTRICDAYRPVGRISSRLCRHLVWRGLSRGLSGGPAGEWPRGLWSASPAGCQRINHGRTWRPGLPVCQSGRQRPVTRTSHDLGIPTRRRRWGDGRVSKIVGRVCITMTRRVCAYKRKRVKSKIIDPINVSLRGPQPRPQMNSINVEPKYTDWTALR